MSRSDGEELQSRPPPGSRLDQSEADLRARVMRALHKKVDSQVITPSRVHSSTCLCSLLSA